MRPTPWHDDKIPPKLGAMNVQFPNSIHRQIDELARREGIAVDQLITTAVIEKTAALMALDYLEKRAKRGSWEKFDKSLPACQMWSQRNTTNCDDYESPIEPPRRKGAAEPFARADGRPSLSSMSFRRCEIKRNLRDRKTLRRPLECRNFRFF